VPLALDRSPVLSAVIGERRTLNMRKDDAPADLADEAARYGVRSAHGEPLEASPGCALGVRLSIDDYGTG
jgi:hypothetical protein